MVRKKSTAPTHLELFLLLIKLDAEMRSRCNGLRHEHMGLKRPGNATVGLSSSKLEKRNALTQSHLNIHESYIRPIQHLLENWNSALTANYE